MRLVREFWPLGILVLVLLLTGHFIERSEAGPDLFDGRCAGCHDDDSQTCVGCHRHKGTITAVADLPEYAPGQTVTVTVYGGTLGGWIRGLLYDHNDVEVDRATGPTGTGDDGLGNPVTFPVTLQAPAPMQAGDYTWRAGWYGASNLATDHHEVTVPITIHVVDNAAVPESPFGPAANALRISPNPMASHGTLHFSVSPAAGSVRVLIIDACGRVVRHLVDGPLVPGEHGIAWDGTDDDGRPAPSGTYMASLSGATHSVTRPLLLLR
jgi:hypothetical protein